MDFYGEVGYGKCDFCGEKEIIFQAKDKIVPDVIPQKRVYKIVQICKACCEKQEKEYERVRMFFSMGKALIELNDALGFEKESKE